MRERKIKTIEERIGKYVLKHPTPDADWDAVSEVYLDGKKIKEFGFADEAREWAKAN